MGEEPSGPGPGEPADAAANEATRPFQGRDPVSPPPQPPTHAVSPEPPADAVSPHPPTQAVSPQPPAQAVSPQPPTQAVPSHPPTQAVSPDPQSEVQRYGPGVPITMSARQAGLTAEQVWRTGLPPTPPVPARRRGRVRQLLGSMLTVILLAASAVLLFLRFHHAPFQVTGAVISQKTPTACGFNVTGRISTNGAPGTVFYEWLYQPGSQPPQPLNQSVVAGQHAVYVTVAVQGRGHGSASQTVTLQVLGPDRRTASVPITINC
jgi:hypothetical protein